VVRSSTCLPSPGSGVAFQLLPPSVVRYRSGPNAQPILVDANLISVTPFPGLPILGIGAGTVPMTCQVLPPLVVCLTCEQTFLPQLIAPSTQPVDALVQVVELATNLP